MAIAEPLNAGSPSIGRLVTELNTATYIETDNLRAFNQVGKHLGNE